jgi:hypothetical protein
MNNRDLIIYCDRGSSSARTLSNVLGCRRWYETSSPGKKTAPVVPCIINWGSSSNPLWIVRPHWPWPNSPAFHMANGIDNVAIAIDKWRCLAALHTGSVPALDYSVQGWAGGASTEEILYGWLDEDGKIVARDRLSGHSGSGLRLVTRREDIGRAPLYTRYYPKTHEFRVHVWGGQVIDFTQKRLRTGLVEDANTNRVVRSLANGWVHSHTLEPFVAAARVQIDVAATQAIGACGLVHGAVDVLARFSRKGARPLRDLRVCEINTAPGLENTRTVQAYADAIDGWYRGIKGRAVVRPVTP